MPSREQRIAILDNRDLDCFNKLHKREMERYAREIRRKVDSLSYMERCHRVARLRRNGLSWSEIALLMQRTQIECRNLLSQVAGPTTEID